MEEFHKAVKAHKHNWIPAFHQYYVSLVTKKILNLSPSIYFQTHTKLFLCFQGKRETIFILLQPQWLKAKQM